MLVALDSEDYLDPKLTKDAYKMGIDMQFMVNLVGGLQTEEYNEDDDYTGN